MLLSLIILASCSGIDAYQRQNSSHIAHPRMHVHKGRKHSKAKRSAAAPTQYCFFDAGSSGTKANEHSVLFTGEPPACSTLNFKTDAKDLAGSYFGTKQYIADQPSYTGAPVWTTSKDPKDSNKIFDEDGGFTVLQFNKTKEKTYINKYITTMKTWCAQATTPHPVAANVVSFATAGCRLVDCDPVWSALTDDIFVGGKNLRTLAGTEEALYEALAVKSQANLQDSDPLPDVFTMGGVSAQAVTYIPAGGAKVAAAYMEKMDILCDGEGIVGNKFKNMWPKKQNGDAQGIDNGAFTKIHTAKCKALDNYAQYGTYDKKDYIFQSWLGLKTEPQNGGVHIYGGANPLADRIEAKDGAAQAQYPNEKGAMVNVNPKSASIIEYMKFILQDLHLDAYLNLLKDLKAAKALAGTVYSATNTNTRERGGMGDCDKMTPDFAKNETLTEQLGAHVKFGLSTARTKTLCFLLKHFVESDQSYNSVVTTQFGNADFGIPAVEIVTGTTGLKECTIPKIE